MPPRSPPADLSIGIEFELIFAFKDQAYYKKGTSLAITPSTVALTAVISVLKEELTARCAICEEDVRFRLPLLPIDDDVDADFVKWQVTTENLRYVDDLDYLGERKGDYTLFGIECRSRMLGRSRPLLVPNNAEHADHAHVILYEEEIAAVLRQLQRLRTFASGDESCYLYANYDSSLHLHIGNYDKGFEDIETVKKILNLNIACERLVDFLHAPCRIDGLDYVMCSDPLEVLTDVHRHRINHATNSPLSFGFIHRWFFRKNDPRPRRMLDAWPESDPELKRALDASDIDAWMRLVREAPTLRDIQNELYPSNNRSTVVNLNNICPMSFTNEIRAKKTIEFRQSEGTLDAQRVLAYVDFIGKMVSYCQTHSWEELALLIGRWGSLREPKSQSLHLIVALECERSTVDYYKALMSDAFVEQLDHRHAKEARRAASHNPLAALAVMSIERERTNSLASNRALAVKEKFLAGGYGLWPRDVVNAVLGPSSAISEEVRRLLSLEHHAKVPLPEYSPTLFDFSRQYRVPSPGSSADTSPRSQSPQRMLEAAREQLADISVEERYRRAETDLPALLPLPGEGPYRTSPIYEPYG